MAVHTFGPFRLDVDAGVLFRGTEPVALGRRGVALLSALVERPGTLISKGTLIDAAWSGLAVEDANLNVQISMLRRVLGQAGCAHWIETMPRRGYRFVGSVDEAQGIGREAPPRLSIVALPFTNIGGDPRDEYFVDGVIDSLTTDLSRIVGLFVIARNTAFTFKGKVVDVKQVGRELNVRYVLQGAIQRSNDRLRVTVQLVEAEKAGHVWADRFDKPFADLFDMQDEIVSSLANTLNTQLTEAEARRAEGSLHPDAMDLCFQGKARFNKGTTPEHVSQAGRFFQDALAIDPRCIEALVGMAQVNFANGANFFTDDRAASFSAAETNAIKALSLAPDHAVAHRVLGSVYIFTNRAAQGIAECERALALDRNLAHAHAHIGLAKCLIGRAAETEGHILQAFRLSPRDVFAYRWTQFVGWSKIQLGAYTEAVGWLRRSIEANRNHPMAHFMLAASLALLGSLDEAQTAAQAGLALNPSFTISRWRDSESSDNPAHLAARERLYEGMRTAGVPEG